MANILTTEWNEANPADSDAPSNGATEIRLVKASAREIIAVDHDFPSSGNDEDLGQHKGIHLQEQADLGTGGSVAPLTPLLGAQTQSNNGTDKPELTYTDEDDTDVQITKGGAISLPTGVIQMFGGGGSAAPTGWVMCDGSAYSRTDYVDLYTVIGTTYGVGDGSTSFNVPDMRGKVMIGTNDAGVPNGADGDYTTRNEGDTGGAETHTLATSEMPAHTHVMKGQQNAQSGDNIRTMEATGTHTNTTNSTGGGGAHENMPPFMTGNFIIKT